jgi:hypothetical protein
MNVFYFQPYSIEADKMVRSKRRATLETIHRLGPQFTAIAHSELEIDSSDLDSEGFQKGLTPEAMASLNQLT